MNTTARYRLLFALLALAMPATAVAQMGSPAGKPSNDRQADANSSQKDSVKDRLSQSSQGTQRQRQTAPALEVLHKKVDQIDWDQYSFGEVIQWVEQQGPVDVIVRWPALEWLDVDEDSLVTLRLRHTTVGMVLAEALEQLSESEPILYRGIGSVIKISTREDFNRQLYVRVYDVRDLLAIVPNFKDGPTIDLTQQGQGGGRGGSDDGSPFDPGNNGDGEDQDAEQLKKERMAQLIELIKTTIEPESWYREGREGGGQGTIAAFNERIVVCNSIEVHEKIGGFFALGG